MTRSSSEDISRLAEIEMLNMKFVYERDTIFRRWRDIRDNNFHGNCQDYAFTVGKIWFGGTGGFWFAWFTFQLILWRAKSPVNKVLPRHAVLYIPDLGYIDSSNRIWRDKPTPHRLVYPIFVPYLVLFLWAWWRLL